MARLRHDHADLARIAVELAALIDRDSPPDIAALSDVRARLTHALDDHLAVEDKVLYPQLLDHADPTVAATARRFVDTLGALAAVWTTYICRWDSDEVDEDWAGFREKTREVLALLEARITLENRELYPLVERSEAAA